MEQKLTTTEQKSLTKSETSIQRVLWNNKETSIEKVLESDSKALSLIKKENTQESALAFIKAFILDLNDFLNVKEKMNAKQIDQTAEIIFANYYYLKVADLKLFFNKIKMGDYGVLYRIDGQLILSFLKIYTSDRMSIAEEKSILDNNRKKLFDIPEEIVKKVKDSLEKKV